MAAAPSGGALACRDRLLSPFGSGSIWNTAIGSEAQFAPANIYPVSPAFLQTGPSKAQCANQTAHPSQRHTCPGAFGGITAAQCAAKGCCFSSIHCNVSCPWCFTPQQEYGPWQFHNDADHFVAVSEADPVVPWWLQGWWGTGPSSQSKCTPAPVNCFCHCEVLPASTIFPRQIHLPYDFLTYSGYMTNQSTGCSGNNGLAMLQPDNVTVIQTQPAYRCAKGGPLLSKSGPNGTGCPQGHPLNVNITSSGCVALASNCAYKCGGDAAAACQARDCTGCAWWERALCPWWRDQIARDWARCSANPACAEARTLCPPVLLRRG